MSDDKTQNVATTSSTGGHPASHAALPKGTRLQEFEVVEVIGEGGFGIVYLADDLQLHRSVAVKEYMPASLASRGAGESVIVRSEQNQDTFQAGMRSFISEARMLAQFKHSALIEVFRFWEQNGTAYMAMPYYKGRTLRQVLHDDSHMIDERWLKSLFAPLMDALDLMHAQNVYHRDVAPDNILILGNGAPVLLDLGAARRIIGDLTQAVTVVLKPGYAPIEQYADDGSATQGPWTDIYAIGAVLYFAITGRAPVASVSRIMKDTLKPLDSSTYPGYSDDFLAGIGMALSVKPEDRPQSIAELREVLGISSYAATTMSPAMPPSATTQSRQKKETAAPVPVQPKTLGADPKIDAAKPVPPPPPAAQPVAQATKAIEATPAFDISSLNFDAPGEASVLDQLHPDHTPISIETKPQPKGGARAQEAAPKQSIPPVQKTSAQIAPAEKAPTQQGASQKSRLPLLIGLLVGVGVLAAAGFMFMSGEGGQDTAGTQSVPAPVASGSDAAATPPALPVESAPASTAIPGPGPAIATPEPKPTLEPKPSPAVPEIAERPVAPPPVPQSPSSPPQVSDTPRPGTSNDPTAEAAPEKQVADVGVVKFSLQPWGEVWVDGVKRGVSPPLRSIKLPVGSHRIEVRNPGLPTVVKRIQVKKGATVTVEHHFASETPSAGY